MHLRTFFADPMRTALVVAILFAAGSLGFFSAVFLGSAANPFAASSSSLSEDQKVRILQALSGGVDTQGRPIEGTGTTTRGAAVLDAQRKLEILDTLSKAK